MYYLSSLKNHSINRIAELLPHNWKSLQQSVVDWTDTIIRAEYKNYLWL